LCYFGRCMTSNTSKPTIAEWAEADRPREKLLLKGMLSLSDAELIAILIGSGSTNESAVDLSKRILRDHDNNLHVLGKLGVDQLTKYKGIGEAKAISIIAAMELARRRGNHDELESTQIHSASQVHRYFYAQLGEINHEEFHVLYLNRSNKVLGSYLLAKGGRTEVSVDSKLLFEQALRFEAVSFIIVHNHPSGKASPSMADRGLTDRIYKCGVMMDLPMLDHVIVAGKQWYSFADNNQLPKKQR